MRWIVRQRFSVGVLAGMLAAGLAGGSGCASHAPGKRDGVVRRVGPGDFAREEAPEPRRSDRGTSAGEAAESEPAASEEVVVRAVGPATVERPAPPTPEGLELIEAKVGDINGKPIYASSFFEPIAARLTAEAERLQPSAWRRQAAQIIAPRLDGMIADELLRAEALASLTPTQRLGLRSFLTNFRNDILTENLGSAQLASRRGQSLDEALRDKEIETLVGLTLFREVNKRVHVSWRDIKQRYERDFKDFNPPPTAVFRMIRLATDDAEGVARVTRRLEDGDAFELVASDPDNTFRQGDAGLYRAEFEGGYDEGAFFGSDDLNAQARSLAVGGTAGPFAVGSYTCWLKLEAIEQESIALYDAQLRINRDLTVERRTEARTEYLTHLIERARVSNRDEILLRLLNIADERYGPRG